MNINSAKRIGSKYALITCLFVLAIFIIPSIFIAVYNNEIDALKTWKAILFQSFIGPGVLTVIITSYFLGAKAGESILIKNKNWIWIGIKTGFLLLWIGTVVSTIGIFVLSYDIKNTLELVASLFGFTLIVSIYASLPLTIISLAFGYAIKYYGEKKLTGFKNP